MYNKTHTENPTCQSSTNKTKKRSTQDTFLAKQLHMKMIYQKGSCQKHLNQAKKTTCPKEIWDVFPTVDVPELYFGCSFHLTPFSKALKYTPKCGKIRQMLYLTCPSEHAVQREGVIFGQNAFSNISFC